MSKNEEIKNEERVVENEVKTTELVEVNKEDKKAKLISVGKKVGKGLAIVGVAALGFLCGRASVKKTEYDESEVIDVDYDVESSEE